MRPFVMSIPIGAIAFSFILTVLMLVLRTVTRGNLPAIAPVMLLAGGFVQIGVAGMLAGATLALLATTCLVRFGLVAVVAFFLTGRVFTVLAAALAWNGGAGTLILAAIVALTLGVAYIAIGSPRLPRTINAR